MNDLYFLFFVLESVAVVIVTLLLTHERKLEARDKKRLALLDKTFRAMEQNP